MKKIAVGLAGFVFAAAILTGSAAQAAHTVAEACEECAMPAGMEQFASWEVLTDVLFKTSDLPPPLVALIRRIVARDQHGRTLIMDQIVIMSFIPSHAGPGPVVKVTVWEADNWFVPSESFEWRFQELVEYISLMQYGREWRW